MFEGDGQPRRGRGSRRARDICRRLGAEDLGEEPGRTLARRSATTSRYRMSPLIDSGTFADTMEVSAPWEKVHDVYERVHAAASQHAFVLCHF